MKLAALIPCRSGSKRVPNKNFRDFCGKPLFAWTVDQAVESGLFDVIIVSSDVKIDYPHAQWSNVIYDTERPPELCTDEVTMERVMAYYMKKHPPMDVWCLLQPTSPLRASEDITGAYKMLVDDERDSVVSVYNDPLLFWVKDCVDVQGMMCPCASFHINQRPNSQDRQDWFKENGAVYFTPNYTLAHTGSRCGGRVGLYPMPKERSYEIDTEHDWELCEYLMSKRLNADNFALYQRCAGSDGAL